MTEVEDRNIVNDIINKARLHNCDIIYVSNYVYENISLTSFCHIVLNHNIKLEIIYGIDNYEYKFDLDVISDPTAFFEL